MKKIDEGGVTLGPCGVSLHSATLSFAVADIIHGMVGILVVVSMIVKQEGDRIDQETSKRAERPTGYSVFLKGIPLWVIYWILASFIYQVTLGMILVVGAVQRNSAMVGGWLWISIFTAPTIPATFCLIIVGRVFVLAIVAEFVWKMDDLNEIRYGVDKRSTSNKEKSQFRVGDTIKGN